MKVSIILNNSPPVNKKQFFIKSSEMYAELGENSLGSQSFDGSVAMKSAVESSPQSSKKSGGAKIKKNSDLRKLLIDDGDSNDLESGVKGKSMTSAIASAGAGADDPYYVFKEDLLMKLELVGDDLQRYERLVKNTVSLFMTHRN